MVVEVGFKLEKDYSYYDNLLKENGLENDFNCITHDIYYTNKNLYDLTEKEMKESCIRLRSVNNSDYKIQNNLIEDLNINIVNQKELEKF